MGIWIVLPFWTTRNKASMNICVQSLCSHMLFLWPWNCATQISCQDHLLQGAQWPEISSCHTFHLLQWPPCHHSPKATPHQWLRLQLRCFHPIQVFSSRPYFLGVSHQSGRNFLQTAVWDYSYWIHSLFSFIHRCQTCVMLWQLSPHKFLFTFLHVFLPVNLLYTYKPTLMSSSLRTQLLIIFGKYLGGN